MFTRTMPFTYKEKCFVKIHQTISMAPSSPDLNPVDYDVYEGSAVPYVSHSDFQPGRSQRQTPDGRISTKRSSTNLLITGVTNWRLWFDWMVDTLNSCFDYLVYSLPCSSKNRRAFCVSNVTMVLWQKVNFWQRINWHFKFRVDMSGIVGANIV